MKKPQKTRSNLHFLPATKKWIDQEAARRGIKAGSVVDDLVRQEIARADAAKAAQPPTA